MIEIAEFQKKLDQSSFVIDEQKKNEDRFLRNNPSCQVLDFFQCQIMHIWHVIHQTELAITN